MPEHADTDPVTFSYSSPRNISFRGSDGVGYTWGEWREMTQEERDEALDEAVYGNLIDVSIDE